MKSNVVPIQRAARKRSFTEAEAFIDDIREHLLRYGKGYSYIAERCGISTSTVHNLASGKTKWPRPTTLFPLIRVLGLELQVVAKGRK